MKIYNEKLLLLFINHIKIKKNYKSYYTWDLAGQPCDVPMWNHNFIRCKELSKWGFWISVHIYLNIPYYLGNSSQTWETIQTKGSQFRQIANMNITTKQATDASTRRNFGSKLALLSPDSTKIPAFCLVDAKRNIRVYEMNGEIKARLLRHWDKEGRKNKGSPFVS